MTIRIEDVATMDFSEFSDGEQLPPATPGDILLHEFMQPLSLSARALALALDVPPNRITSIVNGTRSITAETALLLSRYFAMDDPMFWLNLQTRYDMQTAQRAIGPKLKKIIPHAEAA